MEQNACDHQQGDDHGKNAARFQDDTPPAVCICRRKKENRKNLQKGVDIISKGCILFNVVKTMYAPLAQLVEHLTLNQGV